MDGDSQRSAWLENLESDWRRELQAQRAAVEEIWRTPLAERLADGDALRIVTFRQTNDRQLFAVPIETDACRFREGDFLCLSQNNPHAPTCKFLRRGEDDAGLHLWCWWGDGPETGSDGWVLDRDHVDLTDRYELATRALAETIRGREKILPFLLGTLGGEIDGGLFATTMDEFEDSGMPQDVLWHDSQQEAIAACVATRDGYLVQGPPGTGKTFVLAEVVRRLVENGERVLVTGPTHRAIQHALDGCRSLLPAAIRVVKIGPAMLARGQVEHFETFADSGLSEEAGAYVVGATPFALWSDFTGLKEVEFDTVVLDEASQVTVMVAIMAMLRGERWLFFGDDCQLPPVMISKDHAAPEASIFRLLKDRGFETMLEETWRLNEQLAAWPSATFYGGRLTCRSDRRLALDPPPRHPALRTDHAVSLVLEDGGRATVRAESDAQTVADLVRELVRGGVRPEDIGVITPYRAQAAAIRSVLRIPTETTSLHRRITVDTVERFQGQEREVILVSLASARPGWIRRLAGFLFQAQRWNVAVTRARRKLVVVASRGLIDTAESLTDAGEPGAVCFSSWHREARRHRVLAPGRKGGG